MDETMKSLSQEDLEKIKDERLTTCKKAFKDMIAT